MKKNKLSVVVLSYNTIDLTMACLASLEKVKNEVDIEIWVPDNGSVDGTAQAIHRQFPWINVIVSKINLGYAAGNNLVRNKISGEFVLFLNSDTLVYPGVLRSTVDYLKSHQQVGALTCRVKLPDGSLDKDTRRSFINPWIGLIHLFLKLDRIFPNSAFFAKYWYGYIPETQTHEVDAIQGAFFLTRKNILDQVGWFDEDYFLDGEDIDLCWRIKEAGWKIIYYPEVSILHYKGVTKGKIGSFKSKRISVKNKLKHRMAGVNSQEIFYRKHLLRRYPAWINISVLIGIRLLKLVRFIRTIISG